MNFRQPKQPLNSQGKERSVGVEFEFTGLEMKDIATMLSNLYGGSTTQMGPYAYQVEDTQLGKFTVELDADILMHKKYEPLLTALGIDMNTTSQKDNIEEAIRNVASTVVPFEIITPPIPLSQLDQLSRLVDELRKWKAKGTGSSLLYAFGMHLNPEAPELTSSSILSHLQSYVLLDPWLREQSKINISRNLTPYINEYEPKYIRHILQQDYQPDLETLIRDYIDFGNTRNRPLDLLPMFLHLKPDITKKRLKDDDLSSPRPTYHYRLPNCSIEDEHWSLAQEWNRWCLVEQLAADDQQLKEHSRIYQKIDDQSWFGMKRKWIDRIDTWVNHES